MKKFFLASDHYIIKSLEKAGITFPITKRELLAKIGENQIPVDFNKHISFADYSKNVSIDKFENKAQLFTALTGSRTVFKKAS